MTATDDHADRLAEIAAELACRVRDETPADNLAWLDQQIPDPTDRRDLLFVLAAAIPDDRPWLALTAWTLVRPAPAEPEPDTDPDLVDEGEVLRPSDASRPAKRKPPVTVQPCGTPAAAARHRYHGEDLCEACRLHERIRDRIRKAEARGRAAA